MEGYQRAVSSHTQRGEPSSRASTYAGRSDAATVSSRSPSTTSTRSPGRRESETRVMGTPCRCFVPTSNQRADRVPGCRMNGIARAAAVLFALTWLIRPGWGAIDLSVSWSADANPVLSGGWGLFFSVLVAAPFLVLAVRPRAAAPAVWTVLVAAGSLVVAAVISLEPQMVGLLIWLLLGLAAVAFAPVVERWHPLPPRVRPPGPALAVVAVPGPPWLAYAWVMAGRNSENRPDTDFSSGIDHYSVQAALGLAMFALAVLAACWTRGTRHLGTYVCVCSLYFGALSWGWPGHPGSVGRGWAVACLVWGAAVGTWVWLAPHRNPRTQARG